MRGGQYSLLNLLQKKEEEKRNTFFEILLNTGYQGILRDKTSYIQNVLQTKHPSGQNVLPDKKSLYNIVPHNLCLILLYLLPSAVDTRDRVLCRGDPHPLPGCPPQAVVSLRPGEEH